MASGYIDIPVSGSGIQSINGDTTVAQIIAAGSGISVSSAGGTTTISNTGFTATGDLTDVGTDGIVITGGTGAVVGAGTSIAQHVADSTHNGYLSSVDWDTFNSKQAALSFGNLTDVGTDGIVVTGGTGSVVGAGTSIAQHVSDATHNGYLSSADWSAFNGKQDAGSYITALTGDVTASGPGSAAATIANLAVTNAKIANATIDLTAKVTGALPIANGGTNASTANTALNNLLPSQATNSGKFLQTDGTNTSWAAVGGSGTVTSVSVTTANGVSGSVANPTTTPAISLTLGAITPSSVAATGTVTGSNLSGTNTGDQTITLTGDVTGSGTGSFAATIANLAVTNAKIANSTIDLTAKVTGALPIANGGTGQTTANTAFGALSPMTTNQDLITRIAGVPARLAIGSDGTFLQAIGGAITWSAAAPALPVSTISSNTTAVFGTLYFCNTSGGAFTVTLPAPSAGFQVRLKDSTGSFQANNLTIARAASEKIEGIASSYLAATDWVSLTLISDGTDWFII